MNKLWGHLKTVHIHRKYVRQLCFKCGLYRQGLLHDLSKYSPVELINGVKYFTGVGSPHVNERKAKGRSDAWLHHKAHNKHHSDYWVDIVKGLPTPIDMPTKYEVEMVCDRIAAAKAYLKDKYTDEAPWRYYCKNQDENPLSEKTRTHLESTLYLLAERGEKACLANLKKELELEKQKKKKKDK